MFVFFFFQAEDGIRDLVRSRGLGDVYKRQALPKRAVCRRRLGGATGVGRLADGLVVDEGRAGPVSYTHLTLPTSDLV